jgi:hypothetical protein
LAGLCQYRSRVGSRRSSEFTVTGTLLFEIRVHRPTQKVEGSDRLQIGTLGTTNAELSKPFANGLLQMQTYQRPDGTQ